MRLSWQGEEIELRAERAVWWPRACTLLVADLHLGKGAAFRAAGLGVPAGSTTDTLARLDVLVRALDPARVVILGDLVHARSSLTSAVREVFAAWRRAHAHRDVVLVSGNHDRAAGALPADWQLEVVAQGHGLGPFDAWHHPPVGAPRPWMAGHEHPGVRVRDPRGGRLVAPCFVVEEGGVIVPAFGAFTGLAIREHAGPERLIAVADHRLVDVSPLLARRA